MYRVIVLAALSMLAACARVADGLPASQSPPSKATEPVAGPVNTGSAVNLPKQAGPWIRPDAPRRITEETIFDYMDGAGELYLAYRFQHLDVYEYAAQDQSLGTIVVELYWMKGSDDAFGLLSTDWGGDAVDLRGPAGGREPTGSIGPPRQARVSTAAVPAHDALYGGGLLRFWSGDLYGRVMASRESTQSRGQVLAIARSIVGGRPGRDQPPEILSRVPVRPEWPLELRPERTCFFRSHLVLNSVYYLEPADILGLGLGVDASAAEYRPAGPGDGPVRLIQILYPSPDAAARALKSFLRSYLCAPAAPAGARPDAGAAIVEGTWVGWAARERGLAIVFGPPGEAAARQLAAAASVALTRR